MIGIYKIENTINKKVYIGQSRNIERRWKEELRGQLNDHLMKSFNKYGIDKFSFSVLCECKEPELNDLEIKYITEYNACDKKHGYNLTLGGNGGCWLEELKEKASIRMTGNGNNFYGKHHSEKTLKKLSEGRTGKKHWHYGGANSQETKAKQSVSKIGGLNPQAKRVYQYELNGELVNSFDSSATASRETGIGYSAIKNCSGGISKTAGGFSWEYGEYIDRGFNSTNAKKVVCLETGLVFSSMTSAGKFYDCTTSEIKMVCDGVRKTTHKHTFKYC